MNLKNQPPIFVAPSFVSEMEKLSKAALMDIAWDMAVRLARDDSLNAGAAIAEIRYTAKIILTHRKQAKVA
jgi:hypothetical protein